MTDERMALEALARCRHLPGSWVKRFAADLAAQPENTVLTPRQRQVLAENVWKFRRQIGTDSLMVAWARRRLDADSQRNAFEDAIDECNRDGGETGKGPGQATHRLIYADWLEDKGDSEAARCQRLMVEHGIYPELKACGASYGPDGTRGCNYEWSTSMLLYDLQPVPATMQIHYWHSTRQQAEAEIVRVLRVFTGHAAAEGVV